MLAFRMKRPLQNMDISKLLTPHIDQEKWPEGRDILETASGFRERVMQASQSYSEKGAEECREVFSRYNVLAYKASCIAGGTALKDANAEFQWADAFDDQPTAIADWTYERTCILFNLAASLSFLATHKDRGTSDGIKEAAKLYQQAAGVLGEVKNMVRAGAWKVSADLSEDTVSSIEILMLAQAQKCFYEKAVRDGLKDHVVAKLAAEAAGLYADVSNRISNAKERSRPIARMSGEWLEVVEWNKLLFDGMQHYYQATAHEEAHEYGLQVSRLTYATNRCAEAVNACATASKPLQEQFVRAHASCLQKHTKAKHDNDIVYTEKVPAPNTLPKLERRSMVKPISPDEILDLEQHAPTPAAPSVSRASSEDVAALRSEMAEMRASFTSASSDAAPADAPPSFDDAEAADVAALTRMGFEKAAAEVALQKAGGSVQKAADILLGGTG